MGGVSWRGALGRSLGDGATTRAFKTIALVALLLGAACGGSEGSDLSNPGGGGGTGGQAGADGGNDASTACEKGAWKCVGDELQACNDAQDGYHKVTTCSSGLCDAVGGQCDVCKPASATCSGAESRKVCSADGQSWEDEACPVSAKHCVDGSCIECTSAIECPPSTDECSIPACDAKGTCGTTALPASTPCGPAGQGGACDGSGKCSYCAPGEKRCSAEVPETCGADHKWAAQPACAAPTPLCSDGDCVQCTVVGDCPSSGNACNAATCTAAHQCGFVPAAQGTACPNGTCNGAGLCFVCTPGTTTCNGTTPLACNANGQYDIKPDCSGATPVCDSSTASCVQCIGAQQCPVSSNPCLSSTCTGNTCGFSPLPQGTSCGAGGICNGSGQCNVCIPGTKTCNGNTPMLCDGTGQWLAQTACAGGTSWCEPGTGVCVQCLSAPHCPASSNPCISATCSGNVCGFASVPQGTSCGGTGSCNGAGQCFYCTPGDKTCTGNVPNTCDSNGQWQAQAACSGATPTCVAGICSAPICGNGILDPGEQCDDGNATACDGCEGCEHRKYVSFAGGANASITIQDAVGTPLALTGTARTVELWIRVVDAASRIDISRLQNAAAGWKIGSNWSSVYATAYVQWDHIAAFSMGTTWHHLAWTWDGAYSRLWVDGTKVGEAAHAGAPYFTSQPLFFGAEGGKPRGDIDEIRISNIARYSATFTPVRRFTADSATIGLWHLDEPQGTFADSSGLQQSGTRAGTVVSNSDNCYGGKFAQ